MRLNVKHLAKSEIQAIENAIGTLNGLQTYDIPERACNLNDYEEVTNGAESCYRFKIAEGQWCFIENYGYATIEDSKSWIDYMRKWRDPLDICLKRFCLGYLIDYTEIDEPSEEVTNDTIQKI